jgi:drug/metabolite transporter (DMT)-like permease
MLVALAGTLVTIMGPILKSDVSFGGLEGNLLVLASVIVSAITAILAKLISRNKVDAISATNISFIVGLITILPIVFIANPGLNIVTQIAATPFKYHLGVFYMALLSGTLAYFLWHKAEQTIEVGEVNLIAYLYPIFGAPLAVLWLREKIDAPFIIGCVVIAIGVFLAEYKKRRTTV